MGQTKKSILHDPVASLVDDERVSKKTLQNRRPDKLDPGKESRAYYLTNFAYCLIQGIAEKTGPGPAAMIEMIVRDTAGKYLTTEEIAHLEEIAQAMTTRRKELIEQLVSEQNSATHT